MPCSMFDRMGSLGYWASGRAVLSVGSSVFGVRCFCRTAALLRRGTPSHSSISRKDRKRGREERKGEGLWCGWRISDPREL